MRHTQACDGVVQIGIPGVEAALSATMDYQMNVAGFNVRKFIGSAVDGIELGQYAGVVEEISKAVDEIERETGAPLDSGNDKGWDSLRKRVEVCLGLLLLRGGLVAGAGLQR